MLQPYYPEGEESTPYGIKLWVPVLYDAASVFQQPGDLSSSVALPAINKLGHMISLESEGICSREELQALSSSSFESG